MVADSTSWYLLPWVVHVKVPFFCFFLERLWSRSSPWSFPIIAAAERTPLALSWGKTAFINRVASCFLQRTLELSLVIFCCMVLLRGAFLQNAFLCGANRGRATWLGCGHHSALVSVFLRTKLGLNAVFLDFVPHGKVFDCFYAMLRSILLD